MISEVVLFILIFLRAYFDDCIIKFEYIFMILRRRIMIKKSSLSLSPDGHIYTYMLIIFDNVNNFGFAGVELKSKLFNIKLFFKSS